MGTAGRQAGRLRAAFSLLAMTQCSNVRLAASGMPFDRALLICGLLLLAVAVALALFTWW